MTTDKSEHRTNLPKLLKATDRVRQVFDRVSRNIKTLIADTEAVSPEELREARHELVLGLRQLAEFSDSFADQLTKLEQDKG